MRIAMPVWNNRISPVFDTARILLVVSIDPEGHISQEKIATITLSVTQRVETIFQLGIDLFICGGITRPLLQALQRAGIRTVPFICGAVDQIINGLQRGINIEQQFAMPGRRRRWRHGLNS